MSGVTQQLGKPLADGWIVDDASFGHVDRAAASRMRLEILEFRTINHAALDSVGQSSLVNVF